jgi:hypothetical protein
MLARFATPYTQWGHYFSVVFSPQRPQAQVRYYLTAPKIIEYNFGANNPIYYGVIIIRAPRFYIES